MDFWVTSSFENILMDSEPGQNVNINLTAAKNGYVSAQVVLKCPDRFEIKNVGLIKDVENGIPDSEITMEYFFEEYICFKSSIKAFDNLIESPTGCFPDGLSNERSLIVQPGINQPIWIRFYVPALVTPGTYDAKVEVETDRGSFFADISIKVIPESLPDSAEASLSVSCWSWNAGRLMEADSKDQIFLQYGCQRYSKEWWQVMDSFTESWRLHRINDILIYPQVLLLDGGSTLDEKGVYSFRWERFDELIELFIKKGCVKSINGSRLIFTASTVTGDTDYMAYILRRATDGSMERALVPIESPEASNWWKQFLPALEHHLSDKDLLKLYYQQIGDEPHTLQQIYQWLRVREIFGQYTSQIKVGDAFNCQKYLHLIKKAVNRWVPRLDVIEENSDFYSDQINRGREVWFYLCDYPKGNSLNRCIDQPVWMNRILFWLAAGYNVTGVLHWAWNMWQFEADHFDSKGQSYIVLPDREKLTVKSTLRHESMLEGAQDYELLMLLKRKAPERFSKLVSKVILNRNSYETDKDKLKEAVNELYEEFLM